MADYRAIASASEAVIYLLRSNYRQVDFDEDLDFKVFTAQNFAQPMQAGVSLFLYRIYPNIAQRTPPGKLGADGRRQPTRLPVDLHFLLTAWGGEASLQHAIAGWMMRVLEDNPILPAGLLNTITPGVYDPSETIEIALSEIRTEDLLRIWEILSQNSYQISVPYVARNVLIDSLKNRVLGEPVQERNFDYRAMSS